MIEDALEAIVLRRAQSLTAIVQKEFERMTVSGQNRSIDRLNEQALAARLGISRGRSARRCARSSARGLLTTRLKQGLFVRGNGGRGDRRRPAGA